MANQDDQIILACDDTGLFSGQYIPKMVGHSGEGARHLAIDVLLYNNKGQVLLQKRKHKVFDDIWDVTGATHPLHYSDGSDETFEQATWRCLEREYSIKDKIPLTKLGEFNYFAKYKNNLCENEHCARMIGEYNGEFDLNPEVGYGYKWVDKMEFLHDITKNPQNFSPWAVAGNKFLIESGFFGNIADQMEELLSIVDSDDQVIGRAKRAEVYAQGLLHRAVHVVVTNSRGWIYLQKRSDQKQVLPSYWDISVSEHVLFGESYLEAAIRGLQEELGIKGASLKKIRSVHPQQSEYKKGKSCLKENELVETYQIIWDEPITLDPSEVSEGRFCTPAQIATMLTDKSYAFTDWFLEEWKYLKNGLF